MPVHDLLLLSIWLRGSSLRTTLPRVEEAWSKCNFPFTKLAITDNGSTAIFHNASTIAFSQDVMGASYSYADINKNYGMHSASLFYRIGREGKHGFTVGFRHYKDADFHWEDGPKDHARAWNLEAAYFSYIHPCGFIDKGVTSLRQELKHEVPVDEVKQRLECELRKLLERA